jgi:hypothetical protein
MYVRQLVILFAYHFYYKRIISFHCNLYKRD